MYQLLWREPQNTGNDAMSIKVPSPASSLSLPQATEPEIQRRVSAIRLNQLPGVSATCWSLRTTALNVVHIPFLCFSEVCGRQNVSYNWTWCIYNSHWQGLSACFSSLSGAIHQRVILIPPSLQEYWHLYNDVLEDVSRH